MSSTKPTHSDDKTGGTIMASLTEASNSDGGGGGGAGAPCPTNTPLSLTEDESESTPRRRMTFPYHESEGNDYDASIANQSQSSAGYGDIEELGGDNEARSLRERNIASNDNNSIADSDATEKDPDVEEDGALVKVAKEDGEGGQSQSNVSVGGGNRSYNRKSQRCVPCQWFVRKCSGKNGDKPCTECAQEMARRGREWTCYMDETFIRPRQGTAEGALPDYYRFPGKYGRKRHGQSSAPGTPTPKRSRASQTTPSSKFNSPGPSAVAPTPPGYDGSLFEYGVNDKKGGDPATMAVLVDLLKADLAFCKDLLKKDEGGAIPQSIAYRHIERIESQLGSKLLQTHVEKEEKIMEASVSTGLKKDLIKGNVEDYLGLVKEQEMKSKD